MPDENLQTDQGNETQAEVLSREEADRILATAKATRRERDEALNAKREYERKVQEFEKKYGNVDLEAYQDFLTQKEQAELKRLEDQQEFQTLKQRYQQEKDELARKAQTLEQQIQERDREYNLRDAFLEFGGKRGKSTATNASYFELVKPYLMARTGIVDGKLVPIDHEGLPDLKYSTVEELLAEFANDAVLGSAFEPRNNAAGGGAQNTVRGRVGNSQIERINAIKNPAARLAEARKAGIPLN